MAELKLQHILQPLILNNDQLKELYKQYGTHIEKGLSKEHNSESDIKCFITYVQDLPNGDELGQYLALDLGGTNFRVLLVTLKGHHEAHVESEIFAIPKAIMLGSGVQLFDHIAECLEVFVKKHNLYTSHLPLGFTFSFPCTQLGLKSALLRRWTKGFNCSGVENEDVGRLLKEAIVRRGNLYIDCVAILNDTTGTLMSCGHRNEMCRIAVIIGTGCNVCYVERVENIEQLDDKFKNKPYMLINTECGAFGDSGCIDFLRTEFDKHIDQLTPNVGMQFFEKMISGMYLGELVRLIILKALKHNAMFTKCKDKEKLRKLLEEKEDCFETRLVSEVEADSLLHLNKCKSILNEVLELKDIDIEDCWKLRQICECVSRRAAALIGTALSYLVNKVNETNVVIGVDGSVYRFHPRFDGYMQEIMNNFVKSHLKFKLMLSEDGSGRGAALVAAVASKEN